MRTRKYTKFMGDFETTVYDGQEYTEVWASAVVRFGSEDVEIFHSIDETFEYLDEIPGHKIIYYHNLKFDGEFWLSFIMRKTEFTLAASGTYEELNIKILKDKEMPVNSYKYSISDKGQWYYIVIRTRTGYIEIRDSLKLLPFSVKRIGDSFKTKHKKLEIEYTGFRYAGCDITEEEKEYIKNDVLVVKEALEFLEVDGNDKLTIGSCCFAQFKAGFNKKRWEAEFPNVYNIPINKKWHNVGNVGDFVRRSYRGGWCYVTPDKQGITLYKGLVVDVNSLYPSMMHSMSGNYYPVGIPKFWVGNEIPEEALKPDKFYFVRFRTRFYIKDGYLPFVQIKGSWLYSGTENLTTSDIYNRRTKEYSPYYYNMDGELVPAIVELTMTKVDFRLFLEHYNVADFEILDGCYFNAKCGLFDGYIDKYKEIKQNSKGAMREEAKLFLNNLYGKMATNIDDSFKVAELEDDGIVNYFLVRSMEKKPGYIPIGSAITSYARNFTIRAAQKNYHPGKRGFCYADTDSLHCDYEDIKDLQGVELHDTEFCKWALEDIWDKARFIRQKTYLEVSNEHINIKCAGMPERSKDYFIKSITRDFNPADYDEDTLEFLNKKRTIADFKRGLKVPGKFRPKRILGGVILVPCDYEIR